MKNNPIGVFDSGIGGLTVAAAIAKQLPFEKLIYFGDTKHLPYGDKSQSLIQELTKDIVNYFLCKNVKAIVIACNTASAYSYDCLRQITPKHIPIINVIDPTVNFICVNEQLKNIGLIGTKGTIGSGVYPFKIKELGIKKNIFPLATPLLAPMIEEGFINNTISDVVIDNYLSYFKKIKIDAIILGCTHYPLIKHQVGKYFEFKVEVIDSAQQVAINLKNILNENDLLISPHSSELIHHFYVSNYTNLFERSAKMFFGENINLEEVTL